MRIQNDANEGKAKTLFYCIIKIILAVGVIISFWIFSRFTVDDAFITWRYGKNLVFNGIWNYNPSSYDMTQAYTSPIYAFLSIIPAYFRIDTVLFFKLISLVTVFLFAFYYIKKVQQGILILLVTFLLPHTMIHAFSGLETFLFVALSTILLISIFNESLYTTIITTALLFYTRPESWTLLLIIPLVFCNWQSVEYKDILKIKNYTWHNAIKFILNLFTVKAIRIFIILSLLLLPNMIISYLNFNNILPNTFFAKNTSLFSVKELMRYGLAIFPLIIAYKYITPEKNISIILYYLFIVIQYSKTSFQMDYSLRFLYHIYLPIVLFIFYLIGRNKKNNFIIIHDTENNRSLSIKYENMLKIIVFVLAVFFLSRDSISNLTNIANYYYRCLSAHAETGKVVNKIKEKYSLNSISCGDAGMLAFHADIDSLDLWGLGSAILTHDGINKAYLLYNPDLLFLHGSENEVNTGIFKYVRDLSNFMNIGKITWLETYYLWVYSKNDIPELLDVFENSYSANYKGTKEILLEHIFLPTWFQWHE
jgi:hypothetical protein